MSNEIRCLREFGKFRLDAEKKVLWFENAPVSLQLKEIELLCVLTENGGEVVTKDELLSRVWENSFVEESNLSRHIYQIRKIFKQYGESAELIQTVPRRGYRFTGEIRENGGDLIIERHSISRTLIEELENSDASNLKKTSVKPRRFLIPAVAFAVLLTTAFGFYFYEGAADAKPIKSVAVLPLKSLNETDDKVLSLGFADTLITNLGKINEVRVLPTNAVSGFTDGKREPIEIGKSLKVDAVLEGTFQKANGKLRINLRLMRTSDGKQLWTGAFEESESEIFRLQDEIALKTAKFLETSLNLKNRDADFKRYTKNIEAYRAYQTGRYLNFQAEYEKAIAEFQRALKLDPKYALAYSGLADSHAFTANRSDKEKRIENYEKAKFYALQALALDENLAETHASLGWIRRIYDWDWAESEKHLRRAVELDPNSASAHRRLAYLYITLGKTAEAVRLTEQSSRLNPVTHSTNWALYCNRQYEESAAEYLRQAAMPNSLERQNDERIGAAMALTELERYQEAIALLEQIPSEFQDSYKVAVTLTIARYRAGQTEKALEMLRNLEETAKTGNGYAVRLASVYAVMGRNDEAIRQLQKGLEERDDRMMWLKSAPSFDRLRNDPRFQEILRKMNL